MGNGYPRHIKNLRDRQRQISRQYDNREDLEAEMQERREEPRACTLLQDCPCRYCKHARAFATASQQRER